MSASFLDLNDSISGDLLVLFGACCYALYTVRLSLYASKLPAVPLTAIKLVLLAVFCTLWTTIDFFWTGKFAAEALLVGGWSNISMWLAILYTALVPGVLMTWAQTRGQGVVPAAEAQVMYALTPLFTALIASILLKERVGDNVWVGGAMIMGSSMLVAVVERYDDMKLIEDLELPATNHVHSRRL